MDKGKRALLDDGSSRHTVAHHLDDEDANLAFEMLDCELIGELDVRWVRILSDLFDSGFKSI